jgi:hypothetical protein
MQDQQTDNPRASKHRREYFRTLKAKQRAQHLATTGESPERSINVYTKARAGRLHQRWDDESDARLIAGLSMPRLALALTLRRTAFSIAHRIKQLRKAGRIA